MHSSLKELEVCLVWKELQINIFTAISYFDSFWFCARWDVLFVGMEVKINRSELNYFYDEFVSFVLPEVVHVSSLTYYSLTIQLGFSDLVQMENAFPLLA